MDNKTYLDQIAVKSLRHDKHSFFTPNIIKFMIIAVIALIAMITISSILSGTNQEPKHLKKELISHVSAISAEKGPLDTFSPKVKQPRLRNYGSMLQQSLKRTAAKLQTKEGDTPTNKKVTAYAKDLEDARLKGLLDQRFASATILQISYILDLEYDLRNRTHDANLIAIIDSSSADLEKIKKLLKEF